VSLGGDSDQLRWAAADIGALTNADVAFGAGEGAATVVRTVEVRVLSKRDLGAERARLERALAEAREALRRSRELLASAAFSERAPAGVVAKERARLLEREEHLRLLEEELSRLR